MRTNLSCYRRTNAVSKIPTQAEAMALDGLIVGQIDLILRLTEQRTIQQVNRWGGNRFCESRQGDKTAGITGAGKLIGSPKRITGNVRIVHADGRHGVRKPARGRAVFKVTGPVGAAMRHRSCSGPGKRELSLQIAVQTAGSVKTATGQGPGGKKAEAEKQNQHDAECFLQMHGCYVGF